ncbi:hypothetical protein CRE_26524 [Caenorhabditis remanei]|uniref:VWFA domain-containing protein n=1 Tax=Caenorhabditis remanei TaxID=31234 RepID=E3LR18_CAERE|nr:hypothetical protein CRE_26524 [Caenorhabditis remanei]
MTKLPQTQGVLNFIKKYLYNSTNYKFEDGTTQAINVPYPDSGVYENYILHYPDATSTEILDINIDQLYSEVMVLTDAKIERAYEYILEERDPGTSTTNVLITVGVDDQAVFDGSATSYLQQLQNDYGFRSIVVSIGSQGNYLGDLAESKDWYFTATESNSQWVADQISRIICHLLNDFILIFVINHSLHTFHIKIVLLQAIKITVIM